MEEFVKLTQIYLLGKAGDNQSKIEGYVWVRPSKVSSISERKTNGYRVMLVEGKEFLVLEEELHLVGWKGNGNG